jgi:Kef-type K+ transport system membrane component KefB
LIIAIAVIDDMIALIVLSMLEILTVDVISVTAIIVPIISAVGYLLIGGYIALFIAPPFIHRFLLGKVAERYHKIELALLFGLLLALMPATYYAKASFLMGAFLAGLTFCTSHGLHALFVSQFKRILAWLMRIFFAASIG